MTERVQQRDRWWVVVAAGLAVFIAVLDMSVVNVALPVIERDFATTTSVSEWVVLGYLLPLISLALPSGRWLDTVGRRAALVFSVGGFALASVAVGLAPSIGFLIGARVVQGAFGAVLFALTPVLAATAVRPQARGRALGVVATLGPLGGITGPALGGFLVDTIGWPWIFFLNVPVSAVLITIGIAQLPRAGRLRLPDPSWLLETVLLGSATAALMLALSLAASHGPGWLALAIASVPPVLVWLRLRSSRAVLGLLRMRAVAAPHIALTSISAANGLILFILPFFMHRELGLRPSVIGLTMLGFPIMVALVGLTAGALADALGARRIAVCGAVVVVAGMALLAPLGSGWGPVELACRLGIVGIGAGLFNAPNMSMAMSGAPIELIGTAGASTSVARQLGFAIGPAVAVTIWAATGYARSGMTVVIGLSAVLAIVAVTALAVLPRAPSPRTPQPTHS